MTTRRVLVSGASIAGLGAAYWLDRAGWRVEIVERAPAFRDGGQNVDVRGVAREVVERMGLTGTVRALTTTEEGTRFVDEAGRAVGEFPAEPGQDGPTAEFEILRGDLAGAVRDRLGPGVGIRYDDSIRHIEQDAAVARVDFVSGRHEAYDLVVVAEGVRSPTREQVFGKDVEHVPLGLVMVYGTIEREPADDRWWNWYTATGRRQVMLRPDNVGTTRAMLAYLTETDEITDAGRDERLAVLNRVFDGAGWQTERVLRGFATSDDVYVDHLTQIRMPRWSRGRVCVLGDAAWCVTPLGGGGSSLALTGGYVLAAYLSTGGDDVGGALRDYEGWMRPLVERTQKLPPGVPRIAYPESMLGVRVQRAGTAVAGSPLVRRFAARLMGGVATTERALPRFAEPHRPAGTAV